MAGLLPSYLPSYGKSSHFLEVQNVEKPKGDMVEPSGIEPLTS
jgi:hypothetical protein